MPRLNLATIADAGEADIDASGVAIICAHPDDEMIACSTLLKRLKGGLTLVCLTNGAPRKGSHFAKAGFASNDAYEEARSRELAQALAIVGASDVRIVRLGLWDQEVGRNLVATSRRLAALFQTHAITTVLTHAFEGGHPDHDAAAFCVRAAAELLAPRRLTIFEFPVYHLGPGGAATQTFCDGEDGLVVTLSLEQRKRKNRALKAYQSQRSVLRGFHLASERFRIAKFYDFVKLPNEGALLYDVVSSSFTADDWLISARQALLDLGLG